MVYKDKSVYPDILCFQKECITSMDTMPPNAGERASSGYTELILKFFLETMAPMVVKYCTIPYCVHECTVLIIAETNDTPHFMCIPLYPWLQTPIRTTSLWALTVNTFFLKFKVTFFSSLLLWIFLSSYCCLCSLELKKNHCSVKWQVNKNSFCISDKLNSYKKLEPILRENFTISLPYNLNTSFILQ